MWIIAFDFDFDFDFDKQMTIDKRMFIIESCESEIEWVINAKLKNFHFHFVLYIILFKLQLIHFVISIIIFIRKTLVRTQS